MSRPYAAAALAAVAALSTACGERPASEKGALKVTVTKPEAAKPATPAESREIPIGKDSPHTVGKFDPKTKTLSAGKAEAGHLLYGPYSRMAPGKYRVTFVVHAESDVDGKECGTLDASGFIPGKPVEVLAQAPLKTTKAEQSVTLDFDARNPDHVYQFRVYTNGEASRVTVKRVLLEKF
jgi:hypothetical protein